uniref:non-specific serine/threonine protein kinase n=1 Tax=Aureoumbra lagunensis TaxID=44058 RepID=A0A7S3JUI1_9STRA|mmetsp:Transcript_23580/g.30658  ORF Transcript_23580/g.30658 Transcript_23580/m.30658 type:complete len:1236 (-) Transcript_23580:1258-4965(-)
MTEEVEKKDDDPTTKVISTDDMKKTKEIETGPDEEIVVEKSPRGRYLRFKELLGKGAYKEVWRSYDTVEGIEVAWNVVNLKNLPAAEKARVINEVRLLDRLEHENIIDFHGSWVNREKGEVVFVTEILSSGSLKRFINKVKLIRWKIVKRWCKQILKALAYLHSQDPPIIHRDIKCDNIFINGSTGDLRIGDLGLSTTVTLRPPGTKGQSVLGTPEFMAPELYEESYDEKVDIYAFGMCVIEMITKQLPYDECANATQIYRKVTNNIAPLAFNFIDNILAKEFIRSCVAAHPFERFSAAQLLQHPFLQSDTDFDETEVKLVQMPTIDEQKQQQPLILPNHNNEQLLAQNITTSISEPSTTTENHATQTTADKNDALFHHKRSSSTKDLVCMQPAAAVAEATAEDAVVASIRNADAAVDAAAFAWCEARRNGYEDDEDVRADYNEAIKDNSTRRFKKMQEHQDSPIRSDTASPNEAPVSAISTAYFSANDDDDDVPTSGQSDNSAQIRKPPRLLPDATFNGMWLDTQSDDDDDQHEELIVSGIVQDEDDEVAIAPPKNSVPETKGIPKDTLPQAEIKSETNGESRQQPDDDDDDAYLAKMQDFESLQRNDKVRVHEGRRRRGEDERLTKQENAMSTSSSSLDKAGHAQEKKARPLRDNDDDEDAHSMKVRDSESLEKNEREGRRRHDEDEPLVKQDMSNRTDKAGISIEKAGIQVSTTFGSASTPSSRQSSPHASSRPPIAPPCLQQLRPSSATNGRESTQQKSYHRPSSATGGRESLQQTTIPARRTYDDPPVSWSRQRTDINIPPPPVPRSQGSLSPDRCDRPHPITNHTAPASIKKELQSSSHGEKPIDPLQANNGYPSPQSSDEIEPWTSKALYRHGSSMVSAGGNSTINTTDDDRASVVSQTIWEEVLDDDTVNLSFPYTFDGVAHRVSFDYDLREDPHDVANEFALECGYPIDEVWPLVDFLTDVRDRYRGFANTSVQLPVRGGPPSRQSSDVGSMPQYPSYDSLYNGTVGGDSDIMTMTANGARSDYPVVGSGHDDSSAFLEENSSHFNTEDEVAFGTGEQDDYNDDDDDDDDEELRAWKERVERDYRLNKSRAQTIHEDRMSKLEHSREETVSSDAEAVARIEKELQKLEHKERDLNISRDAVVSDRERLLRKWDKDIQDYERKFVIEQNNHTRRLQEFELQYRQQQEEIRRQRRAKQEAATNQRQVDEFIQSPSPVQQQHSPQQYHR